MKLKFLSATLCAFAASASMHAQVLIDEDFTYSDGVLTTVSGGAWSAHSGGGSTPVMTSSGAIVLNHGSGSREDVNLSFGGFTLGAGQTLVSSFDVAVTQPVAGAVTSVYFAHFIEGTSLFGARIWVTAATEGDYTFALSDGSAIDVTLSNGLTFGTTYTVNTSFNFDTQETKLWVSGIESASITFTAGFADEYAGYAFRQAAGNTVQTLDNLVVTAVPEPSTYAAIFGGLALAGAVIRRRCMRRG